jgi:subtilisin family serine protease
MKTSTGKLKLSSELDELNKKYRIKDAQAVFKNFRKNRDKTKALLSKDKALLNKKEKRILERLKRAPKDAGIPELDRIYKLRIELEEGQSLQEIVAAYNNNPDVEYAELNYIVSINATPNDPLYPLQWSLNNTGQMYPESGRYNPPPGTSDCDIDAPEAWDIYTGSLETIVAVVDTGVDYRHRDLDDNMWVNTEEIAGNGIDDDDNGYVDDIYGYDFYNYDSDPCDDRGHGTHCAGTIAAEGDNGLDIAGVCFNARIMALKFLNSSGRGYASDAVTALYYAVQNGADVISNSWGGGDYSYTLEQAIDYAHSQGVIMVASAGNDYSSSPKYPGYYNHVISVAATNSNDEKVSFSNYGDWVDIAAPGVDILSLRAENTSRGTVYDGYTTVLSGTSMACPHVAGACALLLSANLGLTCDDVNDILMSTVDPIAPEVCKSGRLNLVNAMLSIVSSQGYIILDNNYSSCEDTVGIFLADIDLRGNTTQQVTLATSGGDSETVLLTKTPPAVGIFTGTFPTHSGDPNVGDNTLQVFHGEIITAVYEDADDGTGNPATAADTAVVDCQDPAIFNLQVDAVGPEPRIIFETDEETTARVLCGTVCGDNYFIVGEDSTLGTLHTVILFGVVQETDYYFIVEAEDRVDNLTVDDNGGACYMFTSDVGPRDILVPDMYGTIQEGIDHSWPGGTVWVADGIYQGPGNRDLDFKKRAITVRSVNGPRNCIIDCNGTQAAPHRGVYFHRSEDPNSKLIGFTIQNGYGLGSKGGGIRCYGSSPTIEDCIIRDCHAHYGGGMYNEQDSNPILRNCTFENNLAEGDYIPAGGISDGGGMYNHDSHPTLINCSFIGNRAFGEYDAEMFFTLSGGGGMYNYASSPTLKNCSFVANAGISKFEGLGGGMYNFQDSSPYMEDCTFEDNVMGNGGGMCNWINCNPVLIRCSFKRNIGVSYDEGQTGGGIYNREYSHPTLEHCVFEENEGGGIENMESSHPILRNCTFRNNQEGGFQNSNSDPVLMNCRFIDNQNYNGGGVYSSGGAPVMVNCAFQGNAAEHGGAIYSNCSSPELMNCVFTGNVAVEGGAMHTRESSNPVLVNCTFAENQAMEGKALYVDASRPYGQGYPSSIQATNCIFWNGGDEIRHAGGDVDIDIQYSCVQDEDPNDGLIYPGICNIDDDPLLLDADGADNIPGTEDDIVLLLAGSPCLDAGDNMAMPEDQFDLDGDNDTNEPVPFDRAGNLRFMDDPDAIDTGNPGWGVPLVDMGAYEGSNNGFLLSMESIIVSEGATATFTVALWKEPNETVEAEITYVSGDADITIVSGTHLTFDPSNYFQPQPVTLRAAEDEDFLIGTTLFRIEAEAIHPVGVTAIEGENEPVPEILYVDGSNSTLNTHCGRSWAEALTSITEALQIASEYSAIEEIRVAQGVYTPTDPNGDRQVSFQLIGGVSLLGGYGGLTAPDPNDRNLDQYPTLLSGDLNGNDPIDLVLEDLLDDPCRQDNSYHVVTFSEDEASTYLEGFVITGGNANSEDDNWRGGGMHNWYGNPTVKHCRFFANAALNGGAGICNGLGDNIVIDSCTFDNNFSGGAGGGIYMSDGRLTSIDCTFHRNSAKWRGGGIFLWYSFSTFENCTFRHNSAYWGSGLYNYSRFGVTLNGCVFTGNTAGHGGGGMYNDKNSNAVLNHCIFSGNSARIDGGGIYTEKRNVDLTLNHCTLVANRAGYFAGGMFNEDCEPILSNSIFWGNTDQNGTIESSQIYKYDSDNPQINYCCVQGWTGTFGGMGNIDADPLFVDQGYWDVNGVWIEGDYHLIFGSPCIDAGDPNYIAEPNETDLDGNPRVLDGDDDGIPVIDMGAYEMVTKIEVTMRFTPQVLNCNSKGKWIKAHFILPEGIRIEDVDDNISGRIDPLGIESDHMNVFADEDGLVRVEMAFDRTAFCDGLNEAASMEITVKGFLTNGHYFHGKDTIIIIDNIFEHLAFLSSQWLRADCSKPDWCNGADLDQDSVVNLYDYAIIAEQWMQEQ